MDAVQAANSGHPGAPMGLADVATVLFTKYLKFDAAQPDWPDRDRFVLSISDPMNWPETSLKWHVCHARASQDGVR